MNRFLAALSLTLASVLIPTIAPVSASGTNCWGHVSKSSSGRVLTSDRCAKHVFYLREGEVSRNVRDAPNSLRVIGKMYELGDYNLFESTLIATYDDGQTYWAYGEVFSESDPSKRFKGWVEVGNTDAIVQYHNPGSNDVWYRF